MLDTIIAIAKNAGRAILEIYHNPELSRTVESKTDDSPLTLADQASHEVIAEALQTYFPEIPVLSEEGKHMAYGERKDWGEFWLVDPLDGTKEFIKRNGQFTVNIALIENGYPVLGVIYAPVTDTLYAGKLGECAFKQEGGSRHDLQVNNSSNGRVAVRSASHAAEEEETLLTKYDVQDTISVGSSLKFCMVAEGKADIYYRHGPTMEWDTAAGQAILEAAGGKVYVGQQEEERFYYNKEDLLNTSFLCLGF